MTEDRRSRRSREALHRALIELVLERGYEPVTIKDIVDRAAVSRSTFYMHFDSKDALLTAGLADLRALLTARQQAALAGTGGIADRSLGFSLALFEHAAGYRDVYRAVVGERGSVIMTNRLRGLLADLVRQDLAALAPAAATPVPRSALVEFITGGLMSMLIWWAERDTGQSPGSVDAMFRRLMLPSIAAAVG